MLAIAGVLSACGHAASEQECAEIFQRTAEIALREQGVSSTAEIAKHVEEARASKGKALMKDCVGKTITDRAMSCMRKATTGPELDACLR